MKAAILRITDEVVDCDKANIYEQVKDILEDPENLTIADVMDAEVNDLIMNVLMNSVPREYLENKDDASSKYSIGASGIGMCETKDSLYAVYFIALEDLLRKTEITESDYRSVTINRFASQITGQNVASDMVIVKQNLKYSVDGKNVSTQMEYTNLNEYSLIQDITTIFLHKGIIANVDGTTSSYEYIQNPLENVILAEGDYEKNYRYHEYEVLNHRISVFVDMREEKNDNNINATASHITGHRVYGKALISLSRRPEYGSDAPYSDLTERRLKLIVDIRSRTTDSTQDIGGNEYVNFDNLLELSAAECANLPISPVLSYLEEAEGVVDVEVDPSSYYAVTQQMHMS